jgi:hypothetical protein
MLVEYATGFHILYFDAQSSDVGHDDALGQSHIKSQ